MLELLIRASLARISPALLAEKHNWNNLYYALGNTPTVQKFVAHSIGTTEVAQRLGAIVTAFTELLYRTHDTKERRIALGVDPV